MPEWKIPGYAELRALGSGGFGDVMLARHEESGTLVAVKYLRRELLADPGFATLFRAEAAVLASMDDPNVVRLYEYVESPAGAAIVMELIDGVSVRDILARQGATSAEAALVVLQGSLLGLAAAHARGVVHRDYKPENVLVNGAGVSKLTDFGIAARAGDLALAAGTLAYAPPEQFSGSPASPAGDVYAATATFYECLTGRPPFTGGTTEARLAQHRSAPVPLEAVPGALRPLLTAGLAKDPGDRPADAAAFVTELRTVAAGGYGPDWEDRGRSRLAGAALLLAALWPSAAAPGVYGAAVEQVTLTRGHAQRSREPRRQRHLRHLRHEAHLRHLARLRFVLAVGAAAGLGAVVAVVVVTTGSSRPHSGASVRPVSATSQSGRAPLATLHPSPSLTTSTLPPSPSPGSSGRGTPGYKEYTNSRYGFTVLWPSAFRAQPPPEDGDGGEWISPDGQVVLAAYGSNNVLNYSPQEDEASDASLISVVYSNVSGNIVTVSGYKNGGRTIVYQRDVVGPGSIDTLYWSYPASQKAQWDTAVTLTALSFRPGDLTVSH